MPISVAPANPQPVQPTTSVELVVPTVQTPVHKVTESQDGSSWNVLHRWRIEGKFVQAVTFTIDKGVLEGATNAFGVTRGELDLKYTDKADLQAQLAARAKRFLSKGIEQRVVGDDVQLRAAFAQILDWARPQLRVLGTQLKRLAIGHGLRSTREILGWYASFIQSFSIEAPPRYRSRKDGTEVMTAGVWLPLETVYRAAGDCDSLSLAFAAMAQQITGVTLIFLSGQMDGVNHLLVGANVELQKGDLFVEHNEKRYVLFELTAKRKANQMSATAHALLKGKRFEVIEL